MSPSDMCVERESGDIHDPLQRHKDISLTSSSSTKMATTTVTNSESAGETDFITFLQKKFTNNENVSFITSFAAFVHEKNDEFCIDLDEAYTWLGHSRKFRSVELLVKVLKENVDFLLHASVQRNQPAKYLLKPAAFKKLLLAARTDEAKKAAEYFIKIEEAVFEFSESGGTFGIVRQTMKETGRKIPFKNLPLEKFTQVYDPESRPIVSAGYHDKMQDPQVYIGIVKNMRFVAGSIPEGASVLSFGYTGSADNRLRDHQSKNGDYIYIDHLPCAASYELEQEIRRYLIVMGRLLVGRRLNDSKDYEMFWVLNQADYIELISRFWEKRQQMMDTICKEHGRSVDVAIAKETSLQSMETTKQSVERTKQIIAQADSDARKAEAEADARKMQADSDARKAEAEARKAEYEYRKLELEMQRASIETRKFQVPEESRKRSEEIHEKIDSEQPPSLAGEGLSEDIEEQSPSCDCSISVDTNEETPQMHPSIGWVVLPSSCESKPSSPAIISNETGPSSPSANTPIDLFGEYTREKKVKKPTVAQVAESRQRTSPAIEAEPLSIEKQETIDTFIANCCEMGTDEKPIRDIATQHFFEPQTSLHSVYCAYTVHHRIPAKSAVKYTDFVRGLAARGVVQEFRTYPVKRKTNNAKLNRPLMSFVGIRLKSRPPTDLERDVTAFMEGFTEQVETGVNVPLTTISMLFKSFNTHFPGWSAYNVNQCLLSSGYRIRFHPGKGERAWINVRLVNEEP